MLQRIAEGLCYSMWMQEPHTCLQEQQLRRTCALPDLCVHAQLQVLAALVGDGLVGALLQEVCGSLVAGVLHGGAPQVVLGLHRHTLQHSAAASQHATRHTTIGDNSEFGCSSRTSSRSASPQCFTAACLSVATSSSSRYHGDCISSPVLQCKQVTASCGSTASSTGVQQLPSRPRHCRLRTWWMSMFMMSTLPVAAAHISSVRPCSTCVAESTCVFSQLQRMMQRRRTYLSQSLTIVLCTSAACSCAAAGCWPVSRHLLP